jgi:hypothetical protein
MMETLPLSEFVEMGFVVPGNRYVSANNNHPLAVKTNIP